MYHSSRSRPHNFIWHCTGEGDLKSHSATTHPGTSQPLCKYLGMYVSTGELGYKCTTVSLVYYVLWTHLCNETWKFGRSGRTKRPRVWRAGWRWRPRDRHSTHCPTSQFGRRGESDNAPQPSSGHDKADSLAVASSDQPSWINHLGSRAKKIIDCAGLSPLKCIAWWPASHIPDLACRSPSFINQSHPVNLLRRHPFHAKAVLCEFSLVVVAPSLPNRTPELISKRILLSGRLGSSGFVSSRRGPLFLLEKTLPGTLV